MLKFTALILYFFFGFKVNIKTRPRFKSQTTRCSRFYSDVRGSHKKTWDFLARRYFSIIVLSKRVELSINRMYHIKQAKNYISSAFSTRKWNVSKRVAACL